MNACLRLFGLLAALCALLPAAQGAPAALPVADGLEQAQLARHLRIHADGNGVLSLEDIAALPDDAWTPASPRGLVPGYQPVRAWWIHLRLARSDAGTGHSQYILEVGPPRARDVRQHATPCQCLRRGPPRARDVRLYLRRADGSIESAYSGLAVPIAQRPVPSRRPAFPFALSPGETIDVWARVESNNAVSLRSRLWVADDWTDQTRRIEFIGGLQIGALVLFGLYALVLFGATRERSFLWFSLAMFGYAGYDLSIHGFAAEHLWPGMDASLQVRMVGVFLACNVGFQVMLLTTIVPTQHDYPRHHRLLRGMALLALALLPLVLFADYASSVQPLNLLAMLAVLASLSLIVLALRSGYGPARTLLYAYLLMWAVTILQVIDVSGLYPMPLVTEYPQSWSMIAVGMLLAVAISQRIIAIRTAHDAAQRAMLELRAQAQEKLEHQVRERTAQLVLARDDAEAASRVKSTFLAHMSHELRTPLHAILGYTGLLLSGARDDLTRRRLEAIQRSGNHLLALISELLDFSRGEAGRLRLELRALPLRSWLEGIAEEAQGIADQSGAHIYLSLDAALPSTVRIDPVRLRQVLLNLLVNAVRHSRGNRIALGARLVGTPVDHRCRLRFSVQDNGTGVAPEERAHIFDSFMQGRDSPGAHHGLGLGLPIARQLVQAMGGDIDCEDAFGGGTLFHFTLELDISTGADAVAVPALAGPVSAWRYPGKRRRVLVVDDIADNRDLLAEVLGELGFACAQAGSAEQALGLLDEDSIDLVISDQRMPGRDGWWLLAEARRHGHAQPFVLLSATPPERPADLPEPVRFEAALLKPATAAQLARVLDSLLDLGGSVTPDLPQDGADQIALRTGLDATDRASLRAMVQLGQLTEIEEWLAALVRREPARKAFADEVARLLGRLDFEAIERLLATRPHQRPDADRLEQE
jgi:signal transduction histidine kinase/DNA-binding NarL/FixJ family response regulator